MSETILMQVLAALLATPHHAGAPALNRLTEDDFDADWRAQEVFIALKQVGLPAEPSWQAALVRVNDWLLQHGRFADKARDEGLRDYIVNLAQLRGDTNNLPGLVNALLDHRYRHLCHITFQALSDDARRLPVDDYDEAIRRGLDTIRHLRARLDTTDRPGLKAV